MSANEFTHRIHSHGTAALSVQEKAKLTDWNGFFRRSPGHRFLFVPPWAANVLYIQVHETRFEYNFNVKVIKKKKNRHRPYR